MDIHTVAILIEKHCPLNIITDSRITLAFNNNNNIIIIFVISKCLSLVQ